MKQLHVYFSGHVQGVGFRQTTRRLAQGFQIAGWVRNLEDGRVELLVEGEDAEILRFFKLVCERMKQYINNMETNWGIALNQFTGFEIGY